MGNKYDRPKTGDRVFLPKHDRPYLDDLPKHDRPYLDDTTHHICLHDTTPRTPRSVPAWCTLLKTYQNSLRRFVSAYSRSTTDLLLWVPAGTSCPPLRSWRRTTASMSSNCDVAGRSSTQVHRQSNFPQTQERAASRDLQLRSGLRLAWAVLFRRAAAPAPPPMPMQRRSLLPCFLIRSHRCVSLRFRRPQCLNISRHTHLPLRLGGCNVASMSREHTEGTDGCGFLLAIRYGAHRR
jgi:hypothetical protein